MGNESINWDKLGFDYIKTTNATSRPSRMASGKQAP